MLALASVLLMVAWPASGQVQRFEQRYAERLQQSQDIGRFSASSFGEQLNLKDGSVEFKWTDIDIPGNSKLPVRLQRSLVVEDQGAARGGSLGGSGRGGSLDVPYLKGVFGTNGWQVYGNSPNARCSVPAVPPTEAMPASDYWSGNWMHVPWAGDQIMLDSPAAQLPAPSAAGSRLGLEGRSLAFASIRTEASIQFLIREGPVND